MNTVINNATKEIKKEMNGEIKMKNANDLLDRKIDIVCFIDGSYVNPNGDPDTGAPRQDYETGYGFITNGCINHNIRSTAIDMMGEEERYEIYIQNGAILNKKELGAYEKFGIKNANDVKKLKAGDSELGQKAMSYLCNKYFDIRTHGGVMTKAKSFLLDDGQIRGAAQVTFARSVDPITIFDASITRNAIAREEDAKKKTNEIGNRYIIPYGLYRFHVHISAKQAEKNGFTEGDYELFLKILSNMFENNLSSAKSEMAVRELIVFEHGSTFGDCPAHKLTDAVKCKKKDGVMYPRSFDDYEIAIDTDKIPDTVTIRRMI